MQMLATVAYIALTALLFACDQQHPASNVDPRLGFECFESHRTSLTPGTQYEGIERLADDRLTIRVMNGVELVTLDCGLNQDGAIGSVAE